MNVEPTSKMSLVSGKYHEPEEPYINIDIGDLDC